MIIVIVIKDRLLLFEAFELFTQTTHNPELYLLFKLFKIDKPIVLTAHNICTSTYLQTMTGNTKRKKC